MISSYKDLIVWQKAMDLVVLIYKAANTLPVEERYGLVSQMKRAVVSIPSNIAEGSRRNTRKDYCQFLTTAFGSGAELETQLEIVKRLPWVIKIDLTKEEALLTEIMKMLNTMITGLEK